ncbi:SusC/RagA family TonB-linked outer membrane protein [Bacteroides nordii]
MSLSVWSQSKNIEIKGVVISSADNQPVIGASVKVQDMAIGVVTDIDGNYVLNVPENATAIEFKYLGLQTQIIPFKKNNLDVFKVIMMYEDAQQLDDVVVVGFGKQKKESVIGAIQTVKSSELSVPSSSLTSAFAGKIAGVIAVQRSGEPGADGANFWIRGVSTFAGPTSPLIVLDGVEVSSSELNALAPESIESFSVLKDATATALYGAKGANGVMIITTKSGKDMDKPKINVRVENYFSQPTKIPKLADGVTYMKMYNEGELNRNPDRGEPYFSEDKINGTMENRNPYVYPNVDWYKQLFGDLSSNQSVNLNVMGGSRRVDYFINASIFNERGLLKDYSQNQFDDNNIRQTRYSFQSNINAQLTKTTKVGLRLTTQIKNYSGPNVSTATLFTKAMQVNPVYFPAFFPNLGDGDVKHIMFGHKKQYGIENPLALYLSEKKDNFETNVLSTFTIEQKLDFLTKGLSAKGLISFQNWSSSSSVLGYTPFTYEVESYEQMGDGSYNYTLSEVQPGTEAVVVKNNSNGGNRTYNLQLSLDYNRVFNDVHSVSAMLLYHQREYKSPSSNFYDTLPLREQGLAGRATYNYDNRYFAEFNFGYNGSDNFMKDNRMGFFPSMAVGYMISNERFFETLKDKISLLKVRASYGLVGNSFTSPRFPYITEVNLGGRGYTFGEDWNNTQYGATIVKYGAENAKWETGEKVNIGLEFGLFDKLTLITDFFYEMRKDIFMQRRTMPTTVGIGEAQPYINMGKVKNKGVDLSLEYNHAFRPDILLSVRGNFTYAANELVEKDEPRQLFPYQSEIGLPLNMPYGLIAEGLFKDEADIENSPKQTYVQVKPGDIKYKDMNGDNVIDDFDMTYLGNPEVPQIVYGFGASLNYKKVDISLFFQGVAKTSIVMSSIHPFGEYQFNVYDFIAKDYWSETNPNPNAAYPRLSDASNTNNSARSDFWIRNGAFLRLKNAEIGFTHKFLRVYVSGTNLLTFSKFKYWDPEVGSGSGLSYPTLRVVNVGLQLNF